MLEALGEPRAMALVGLLGGVLLGLAARLGRFCSMGAVEDALYGNDTKRLRMWGVAIGIAIIGSFMAEAMGAAAITDSIYLTTAWSPVASILGGLAFGYGMALAGNCGFGALARVGGGDFRSFVIVLIMGLSAYAVLSGPLAGLRLMLFPVHSVENIPAGIAHSLGSILGISVTAIGVLIGVAILIGALANRSFLQKPQMIFWAAVAGLAVLSGWIGTTWISENGFAAREVVSHTFAAPLGETMVYLMTASGRNMSFAVGSVAGVLLGAFAGSLIKGQFRWEACDDPRELRRQVFGAALMGAGAAIALGCTVGQGLSAFSTLAFSAPVTAASIFAGAAIGLRQLIAGFERIA